MQFRTSIPITRTNSAISYDSEIVSLGSCFAVNMAEKFEYFKFRNGCNPFGILFHPLAIEAIIRKAVSEEWFAETDVFFHNALWHCFDVHSGLSHPDKEKLLQNLNGTLRSLKRQLTQSTHIVITYGTSWIYRHADSGKIVANCHKLSQAHFEKELLDVVAIRKSIQQTVSMVAGMNPGCNIIFTVSPVRHIKDGFIENQRSKAHLIAAVHEVMATRSSENALLTYFPAYEIMMDELRDYRFYAEDMLHPNFTAINYIWQRFSENHISESAFSVMEEIKGIRKAMQHKPFHADSEQHRQFLSKLESKITALQKQFPFMEF